MDVNVLVRILVVLCSLSEVGLIWALFRKKSGLEMTCVSMLLFFFSSILLAALVLTK